MYREEFGTWCPFIWIHQEKNSGSVSLPSWKSIATESLHASDSFCRWNPPHWRTSPVG